MAWQKRQPRIYKTPNSQIRYAGRLDLVCMMLPEPGATKKIKTVADFKTGKAPNVKYNPRGYTEWALQTAAYRQGVGDDCKLNGVVHLDKETGNVGWFPYGDTYRVDVQRFKALVDYWWFTFSELHAEKLIFGAPSVTTVCGVLDKPALVQWAANCVCDYVREETDDICYWTWGDTPGQCKKNLWSVLESAKTNYRKVSAKAMDIGTQVHKYIEEWIKSGGKMEPPPDAPDEVTTSFVAFLDWWRLHEVEPLETEVVIYHG